MKNKLFFTAIITFGLLISFNASARNAVYKCQAYELNVSYNDTTFPGDVVFVRMKLTAAKGQKNSKNAKTSAKAVITDKKKNLSHSDFFQISASKKNTNDSKDSQNNQTLPQVEISFWKKNISQLQEQSHEIRVLGSGTQGTSLSAQGG